MAFYAHIAVAVTVDLQLPQTRHCYIVRNMQDVTTLDTVSEHATAETNENLLLQKIVDEHSEAGPDGQRLGLSLPLKAHFIHILHPFYAQPKLKPTHIHI